MVKHSIESDLRRIVAEVLTVDEEAITDSSDFCQDFKAEYLDLVEIAETVDEMLGITIPDDYDLEALVIFADWVAVLATLPKRRGRRRAKSKDNNEEDLIYAGADEPATASVEP